jgi:hypothetical protein
MCSPFPFISYKGHLIMNPDFEKILKAKSSDGDFYNVKFTFREGTLRIKCDCKAGQFMQLCKHKLMLLCGDDTILYEDFQMDELLFIKEFIKNTGYPELIDKLNATEQLLQEIKRQQRKIKESLELAMKKGV